MDSNHRTGDLFKRGSSYYVRALVEGKVIVKALRDDSGNAITRIREANWPGKNSRLLSPSVARVKSNF
jgi:hypothetical protein